VLVPASLLYPSPTNTPDASFKQGKNRMKLLNLMPILLVAAAPVFATTITASGNDGPNWDTSANQCPGGSPATCVIGSLSDFAIQSATFTVNNTANGGNGSASAEILTNFGDTTLAPYIDPGVSSTVTFSAADMLIAVGGNEYALVLNSHGGLATGGLYLLTGEETASQALSGVSGTYRTTLDVWGNPTGAIEIGLGSVSLSSIGGTELEININNINPVGGHNFSALVNPNLNFEVASADCGNSVVYGAVPEPGTLALAGSALVGLVFLSRRRSRK
jgi:hypothetical protein